MVLDPVALERRADLERDLGLALQRAGLDAVGDRLQICFGRLEQLLAVAAPVGPDQRVAAHHQPLVGIVLGGDLGQVELIKQR